jgi:hypothetical protein
LILKKEFNCQSSFSETKRGQLECAKNLFWSDEDELSGRKEALCGQKTKEG